MSVTFPIYVLTFAEDDKVRLSGCYRSIEDVIFGIRALIAANTDGQCVYENEVVTADSAQLIWEHYYSKHYTLLKIEGFSQK